MPFYSQKFSNEKILKSIILNGINYGTVFNSTIEINDTSLVLNSTIDGYNLSQLFDIPENSILSIKESISKIDKSRFTKDKNQI